MLKNKIVDEKHSKWRDLNDSIKDLAVLLTNMDIEQKNETPKDITRFFQRTINYKVKKAIISCYYKSITFGSEIKYALRIFYNKPYLDKNDTLFYKDFIGSFEETTYGCCVKYETIQIGQDIPSDCRIIDSYFYQNIKDNEGAYFPEKKNNKETYLVQRIMINSVQIMATLPQYSYIRTTLEDFVDYCLEKDRTSMDIDKLHRTVLSLNTHYKTIEKG